MSRGVRWAVSNSDTPIRSHALRRLHHAYESPNRREINLNSQERDIHELLITNYG